MASLRQADDASYSVNYTADTDKCKEFLKRFKKQSEVSDDSVYTYVQKLQEIAARRQIVFEILLDDIKEYFESDPDFYHSVQRNAFRYTKLFCKAIDEILRTNPTRAQYDLNDPIDVMMAHRAYRPAGAAADANPEESQEDHLPPELTRRYEVYLIPEKEAECIPIRQMRASRIARRDERVRSCSLTRADLGSVISTKGIVTRVSEVKPLVTVVTYLCPDCSSEFFQAVESRDFMPLADCTSSRCKQERGENRGRGKLNMQFRGSKFVKFQEIRLQELTEHVPIGHIPRSTTVYARGERTKQCSPGDLITVDGIFVPTPYSGRQAAKAGLIADTYLESLTSEQTTRILQHKKSYSDYVLTPQLLERIQHSRDQPDLYGRLARSIAPEIFGHEDVKKTLLLLMVGGCTRALPDGMKIRGDLHVCLMGDPGVAKSQLLRHIASGASGVGLTAAVIRDPVTSELVLGTFLGKQILIVASEGGSLVLADMGICCIDEFDKMEEGDRTAIHEVMEQQTISIAKAGITTSLNARTAILSAANPAYGRYNPNYEQDLALAKHVTFVHTNARHPPLQGFEPFDMEFMRGYIAQARKFEPMVPDDLDEYIVSAYTEIRARERSTTDPNSYTTARTLLSILRLAQALARLKFSKEIEQSDVDEALRLMTSSKISLAEDRGPRRGPDPLSAIFGIIKEAMGDSGTVPYAALEPRILTRGYTKDQLQQCLDEYETLNVLQVSANKEMIRLVVM